MENYVSDSLHLTLAMITYSHCRQQTNSEICSVDVFLVSEGNSGVARRICIVQGKGGVSSKILIISYDVKVLNSEH